MFDNLREQANSSPFYEEEAKSQEPGGARTPPPRNSSGTRFLGMTGPQRFIISALLMVAVCVLGAMCLLITGKFGLY